MRMSLAVSVASCASALWRMRIASIWLEITGALVSCWRGSSGKPTSTTMTTSTPMARAMSTGTLSAMPPSTSRRPSRSTGANTPGAERLARIAMVRSPEPSTTLSPVSRSVATARKGVGSSSKLLMRATGSVSRRSVCVSLSPWINPFGSTMWPSRMPSGNLTRKVSSSCLRRRSRSSRAGRSRKASCQLIEVMIFSISPAERPLAYSPPTTAPMLVPAIASTGTRSCSSTLRTPTCAAPRAPPPESTSPMRGRCSAFGVTGAGVAGACE